LIFPVYVLTNQTLLNVTKLNQIKTTRKCVEFSLQVINT